MRNGQAGLHLLHKRGLVLHHPLQVFVRTFFWAVRPHVPLQGVPLVLRIRGPRLCVHKTLLQELVLLFQATELLLQSHNLASDVRVL